MQKLKIFLTGGSGFIGRNIIEQLGGVYTILATTHQELDLTDADAVLSFIKENPVDIVIHAAAVGVSRKDQSASGAAAFINLKIFFNLIRARQFFKRLIMLGSGAEYDKRRSLVKVSEKDFESAVPVDEYGFYKYVCAQFAMRVDYITHLRLFGVFGKYEDYKIRFISNVICQALFDLPINMRQRVKFDYLYIDDLVKIINHCIIDPPQERCLNVGSGAPVGLYPIAEKILALLRKSLPINIRKEGFGKEYSPDIQKFKDYWPEFEPSSLEQSLAQLIPYYETILPTLNKKVFTEI